MWDAAVIGGGIYGATIARYLREKRGFSRVTLIEREPELMRRASSRNQARVHGGYHYPRSLPTARGCRAQESRFVADHPTAIRDDVRSVYAISRLGSRTSARQFVRFCREIEAEVRPAGADVVALFAVDRVEAVFEVPERVMDTAALARSVIAALGAAGVAVQLGSEVLGLRVDGEGAIGLDVRRDGETGGQRAQWVFNCTYGAVRTLAQGKGEALHQELAELAVVRVPPELHGFAITVMDGPFFSVVPHAPSGAHTLSHVRHTPHLAWSDEPGVDPTSRLRDHAPDSRFDRMIRAAAPWVPALGRARYVESIFEVKTVLRANDTDDGRPILFERSASLPGCFSVLGGKIDNVYDILDHLDREPLPLAPFAGGAPSRAR